MVFHWSLNESKSPQVARTLLSSLAVNIYSFRVFHISISWWLFTGVWVTASLLKSPGLFSVFNVNNAVAWRIFSCPLISKLPSSLSKPLGTVPSARITTVITLTHMFHCNFVLCLGSSTCLFFQFLCFLLCCPPGWQNPRYSMFSFFFRFLLIIFRSGFLARIRGSVCISKSQRILCVLFSRTDSGLCRYQNEVWSNLNFLHNSHWINFPIQSCLFLYIFEFVCYIFYHIIVSSLSSHNLHDLVSCGCRMPWLHLYRWVGQLSTSVRDMTLNNQMARLKSWNFGKYKATLYCHRSRVHSELER